MSGRDSLYIFTNFTASRPAPNFDSERKVIQLAQAKDGDTVRVHYTGKLSDGMQFDSSTGRDPLEFTLGEGKLISGFEQAVKGMNPGDTKTVQITADDAYGQRRDELVMEVDRSDLPPDLDPKVGDKLEMSRSGQSMVVSVTGSTDDAITLDANHPLAGEDLTFDLELVEIV